MSFLETELDLNTGEVLPCPAAKYPADYEGEFSETVYLAVDDESLACVVPFGEGHRCDFIAPEALDKIRGLACFSVMDAIGNNLENCLLQDGIPLYFSTLEAARAYLESVCAGCDRGSCQRRHGRRNVSR